MGGLIAYLIGVVIGGGIVSLWLGAPIMQMRKEAVERGLALYDPLTGKWRWKEPESAIDTVGRGPLGLD